MGLRRIAGMAFAALLIWAVVVTSRPHGVTGAVAAAAFGLAAAVQLVVAGGDFLGTRRDEGASQVDDLLRGKLAKLINSGAFGPYATKLSLHAWEVPVWYRRIFPYRFRKWTKKTFRWHGVRPKLRPIGHVRVEAQTSLEIPFKKGKGLVGACIAENELDPQGRPMAKGVDFRSATYRRLLAAPRRGRVVPQLSHSACTTTRRKRSPSATDRHWLSWSQRPAVKQ